MVQLAYNHLRLRWPNLDPIVGSVPSRFPADVRCVFDMVSYDLDPLYPFQMYNDVFLFFLSLHLFLCMNHWFYLRMELLDGVRYFVVFIILRLVGMSLVLAIGSLCGSRLSDDPLSRLHSSYLNLDNLDEGKSEMETQSFLENNRCVHRVTFKCAINCLESLLCGNSLWWSFERWINAEMFSLMCHWKICPYQVVRCGMSVVSPLFL